MAEGSKERPERILIIEDDRSLREGLAMNFRLRGFPVITAADGDEGMAKAFDARPDLIVLDMLMPGCSGIEILEELRARGEQVAVLVLSARGSVTQKVEGLTSGADDYMSKPFELPELLARVEALLRRGGAHSREPAIRFGDIEIDVASRTVRRLEAPAQPLVAASQPGGTQQTKPDDVASQDGGAKQRGEVVALSAREFDLLCLLARSPGKTFSRETILDRVWGWGFEGTPRTVDNFILSLRRKLESDPSQPRHIVTVRQVGYRLDV